MTYPNELKYTKTHEWVLDEGEGVVAVGLTDFAQGQMGDLVFIDLPETGSEVKLEESFADVESVKSVSEVYAPVSGNVIAVNKQLEDAPEFVNQKPYEAWLIKVSEVSEEAEYLNAQEYESFCREEEGD